MLTTVAAITLDDIAAFELGVICEVFGTDRGPEFPRYDFALCSVDGGPVTSQSGFTISPHADLGPVTTADLVAVPAHPIDTRAPEAVLAALRAPADPGAMILTACSGATPGGAGERRGEGPPGTQGAAPVRPPVPGGDGYHAARLADRAAGTARPAPAGGHRPGHRRGGGAVRIQRRGDAPAPLQPAGGCDSAGVPVDVPGPVSRPARRVTRMPPGSATGP